MPDCTACLAATTNPHPGRYHFDCLGCQIRHLANAPQDIRERFYSQILDEEEKEATVTAVLLEFQRQQRLQGRAA